MIVKHGHRLHETAGEGTEEEGRWNVDFLQVKREAGADTGELRATNGRSLVSIDVEFQEGDGFEDGDLIPKEALRALTKGKARKGATYSFQRRDREGKPSMVLGKVTWGGDYPQNDPKGKWEMGGPEVDFPALDVFLLDPDPSDLVLLIDPELLLQVSRSMGAKRVELRIPAHGTPQSQPVQVRALRGDARGVLMPTERVDS